MLGISYVVLKLIKYEEELPQIGRVEKINSSTVTVNWLIGSYSGVFSFWKEKGKVICETYPIRSVMCSILFSSSMRMNKKDVQSIKLLQNLF